MELGQSTTTTMFIGNPGVGKSTLLNCLLGEPIFKSGVSFGTGMTQVLQIHTTPDGNSFADTPGLTDAETREQAAKEIERGLKLGGVFKIFFVVVLEAGRVHSDDLTTMKLILESAPQIKSNYSIIINKLPKQTHQRLHESKEDRMKVITLLNIACNTEAFAVYLNCGLKELEDEDNRIAPLEPQLPQFINDAPRVAISPDQVECIRANEFEKISEELSALLTSLKNDNKKLSEVVANQSEEMKRIEEQHKQARKELEVQCKREREEREAVRDQERKEHQEERKRDREEHNEQCRRDKKQMEELKDRQRKERKILQRKQGRKHDRETLEQVHTTFERSREAPEHSRNQEVLAHVHREAPEREYEGEAAERERDSCAFEHDTEALDRERNTEALGLDRDCDSEAPERENYTEAIGEDCNKEALEHKSDAYECERDTDALAQDRERTKEAHIQPLEQEASSRKRPEPENQETNESTHESKRQREHTGIELVNTIGGIVKTEENN